MNKTRTLFFALIIGLTMVSVSCGPSNSNPTTTSAVSPVTYTVDPSRVAQAPWLATPTYTDPAQPITVARGDSFAIGLYVVPRLGEHWVAEFDDSTLSNPNQEIVFLDPKTYVDGTAWFMFNALKAGDTKISFQLVTSTNRVRMQTTFDIRIPK